MSNVDVFKEYLVKLGFQVDDSGYKKAVAATSNLEKYLGKYLSSSAISSVKAAGSIVGAMAAITASVIKTVDAVAQADMRYQLLAQRMFMSTQAAKAFATATEALGHNLQEIAWNAELKSQYFELVKQINDLETPPEAKEMFKQVRAINFEFTRLKVDAKYAVENMAYEILKLNKNSLSEFHSWLVGIGKNLRGDIKEGAASVATIFQVIVDVLKVFGRVLEDTVVPVFKALWKVGQGIKEFLLWLWDKLPPLGRQLTVFGALLLAVFLPIVGPILTATAALTTLYLLFDDFYAFLEGRESSEMLKPMWEILDFLNDELKKGVMGMIILFDHFWTSWKGEKHWSGMGVEEHLISVFKEMDEEQTQKLQDRADKVAANKARIAALKSKGGSFERNLLEQISRGEGTSDEIAKQKGYASGYDVTLGYGKYAKEEKPITEMTFKELREHQKKMINEQIRQGIDPLKASSASGKYQFTGTTLFGKGDKSGLLKQLGISEDEKFTPEMQEKLALALIEKDLKKFKEGKISFQELNNVLSGRWASIEQYGTGKSKYEGQGMATTSQDILNILSSPPPTVPVRTSRSAPFKKKSVDMSKFIPTTYSGLSEQMNEANNSLLPKGFAPGVKAYESQSAGGQTTIESIMNNVFNITVRADKDPERQGAIIGNAAIEEMKRVRAANVIKNRVHVGA